MDDKDKSEILFGYEPLIPEVHVDIRRCGDDYTHSYNIHCGTCVYGPYNAACNNCIDDSNYWRKSEES